MSKKVSKLIAPQNYTVGSNVVQILTEVQKRNWELMHVSIHYCYVIIRNWFVDFTAGGANFSVGFIWIIASQDYIIQWAPIKPQAVKNDVENMMEILCLF